jgi:MFS family permease
MNPTPAADDSHLLDSRIAWLRCALTLVLGTAASAGMWVLVVVLPKVQADFGVDRAGAALPYTASMLGFAVGTILIGRLVDKRGIVFSLQVTGAAMGLGFLLSGWTTNYTVFVLLHGLLIGSGAAVGFAPLIADISHWFVRRRGLAVTIVASGNYVAGTLWPLVMNLTIPVYGWRATYILIGIVVALVTIPGAMLLRGRPSTSGQQAAERAHGPLRLPEGLTPNQLTALLTVAGFACCVAMSMPQVHIVAYCGDLGYGVARGAEMLSLMLSLGIISRVGSGFIADRIGAPLTLVIGSMMQGVALALYLFFDGISSLYVISGIFGLFQGGIVPMYAVILRGMMPPQEAGMRIGIVISATVIGMAAGGWLSGEIFDWTGSYRLAFLHGLAWNLVNLAIVLFVLMGRRRRLQPA